MKILVKNVSYQKNSNIFTKDCPPLIVDKFEVKFPLNSKDLEFSNKSNPSTATPTTKNYFFLKKTRKEKSRIFAK